MTTLTGRAKLAKQIGAKGFFADVEVEATLVDASGKRTQSLSVEYCCSDAPQWRESAIVGVRTAWGSLPSKHTYHKQTIIRIKRVDWNPVDTTEMTVLFVAAKATLALFDIDADSGPAFLLPFGGFVFNR